MLERDATRRGSDTAPTTPAPQQCPSKAAVPRRSALHDRELEEVKEALLEAQDEATELRNRNQGLRGELAELREGTRYAWSQSTRAQQASSTPEDRVDW